MPRTKTFFPIAFLFVCSAALGARAQVVQPVPPVPTDAEIETQRQKYVNMLRKQAEIQRQIDTLDNKVPSANP